jgi:hypothetical protein
MPFLCFTDLESGAQQHGLVDSKCRGFFLKAENWSRITSERPGHGGL